MVKLCAMHVCNLGVTITANGGTLNRAKDEQAVLVIELINVYQNTPQCKPCFGQQQRKTLIDNGIYGSSDDHDLRQQLHKAFCDFQSWRRANKVPCSQRCFTPKLLVKKCHGAYLSCKAFNGRVVLAWLAERSVAAARAGSADPRLPVQAVAMTPGIEKFLRGYIGGVQDQFGNSQGYHHHILPAKERFCPVLRAHRISRAVLAAGRSWQAY